MDGDDRCGEKAGGGAGPPRGFRRVNAAGLNTGGSDSGESEIAGELNRVLPADLPHRGLVIRKSAWHLECILEANRHFNLTRITSPREAAVKHVLDSLVPWR